MVTMRGAYTENGLTKYCWLRWLKYKTAPSNPRLQHLVFYLPMPKTDCSKTLEALRNAGSLGVHSFDLNNIVGTNYSPRMVHDLKKAGYSITAVREKLGDAVGVRYFLNYFPVDRQKLTENYTVVFDDVTHVARKTYVN